MPRYVDIEPYDDYKIVAHNEDNGFKCADLPTADVVPINHGKWKKEYTDGFGGGKRNYEMICPFCDYSYFDNHCGFIVPEHFNYCPHCGAKMDLEIKT